MHDYLPKAMDQKWSDLVLLLICLLSCLSYIIFSLRVEMNFGCSKAHLCKKYYSSTVQNVCAECTDCVFVVWDRLRFIFAICLAVLCLVRLIWCGCLRGGKVSFDVLRSTFASKVLHIFNVFHRTALPSAHDVWEYVSSMLRGLLLTSKVLIIFQDLYAEWY